MEKWSPDRPTFGVTFKVPEKLEATLKALEVTPVKGTGAVPVSPAGWVRTMGFVVYDVVTLAPPMVVPAAKVVTTTAATCVTLRFRILLSGIRVTFLLSTVTDDGGD